MQITFQFKNSKCFDKMYLLYRNVANYFALLRVIMNPRGKSVYDIGYINIFFIIII